MKRSNQQQYSDTLAQTRHLETMSNAMSPTLMGAYRLGQLNTKNPAGLRGGYMLVEIDHLPEKFSIMSRYPDMLPYYIKIQYNDIRF